MLVFLLLHQNNLWLKLTVICCSSFEILGKQACIIQTKKLEIGRTISLLLLTKQTKRMAQHNVRGLNFPGEV